jgi:hypothetical protein
LAKCQVVDTYNKDIFNLCEGKTKSSQYQGVSWHKNVRKWCVVINLKEGKKRYGGTFNDELEAAKRVNQFCIELGLSKKNPGICGVPNQQVQVTSTIFCLIFASAITKQNGGNKKVTNFQKKIEIYLLNK